MIVLNATNKSLQLRRTIVTNMAFSSVVSYWSIDTSNVWTPGSFEVGTPTGGATDIILLPAPGAGETRVVENVWIHAISTNIAGDMEIFMDSGGSRFNIGILTGVFNFVFTLGRDGAFTRQITEFTTAPTATTQNVH